MEANSGRHKKGDEKDNLAGMDPADTGKEGHGKEEKQHVHSHHSHRREHVGGKMEIDLVEYIDLDAQSTAGAFLNKKYLALTGRKYDKAETLISPDNIGKGRKEDEEAAGSEKNKGVIYEF